VIKKGSIRDMTNEATRTFVDREWESSALPALCQFIQIPNTSPNFDQGWEENGLLVSAAEHLANWVKSRPIVGTDVQVSCSHPSHFLRVLSSLKPPSFFTPGLIPVLSSTLLPLSTTYPPQVKTLPGLTPVLFITIEPTGSPSLPSPSPSSSPTILIYGHLDKQPPLTEGWMEGLHPYQPEIREGKLYGRGGADDGYCVFSAILGVEALQKQGMGGRRRGKRRRKKEEGGRRKKEGEVGRRKEKEAGDQGGQVVREGRGGIWVLRVLGDFGRGRGSGKGGGRREEVGGWRQIEQVVREGRGR
jgi:hypothetical protein